MNGFTSRGVNGDGDSPTKTKIADDDAVKSNANRGIFDKFQHSDCYKTPIAKPRPVNESDKDKVKCLARCGSPEARAALYRNGHDPYVAAADIYWASSKKKCCSRSVGNVINASMKRVPSGIFYGDKNDDNMSAKNIDVANGLGHTKSSGASCVDDVKGSSLQYCRMPSFSASNSTRRTQATEPPYNSSQHHTKTRPTIEDKKSDTRRDSPALGQGHRLGRYPFRTSRRSPSRSPMISTMLDSYDRQQAYSWDLLSRLSGIAEKTSCRSACASKFLDDVDTD